VNDTLTLVGHTEELNAELLDVLLKGDDLETRVRPAGEGKSAFSPPQNR
jgi:hypothetical protein